MKDVVYDIGAAWDMVEDQHIHKCFENLISPEDYLNQWNETHSEDLQWPGPNFRGFKNDNSATDRANRIQKIKDLVSGLQARIDTLPEAQRVTIDPASVEEVMLYDPTNDEDPEELLTLGFLGQREDEGLQSEDNDRDVPRMAHEALKSMASIGITFRRNDFKSKEAAEQASTHLKALQKIFLEMKDPKTTTIPTQPRPASRPPSPQPGTSGVTTIRPSPVRSVPAENESLDAMEIINVTRLDYEPEVPAADGDAADGDATDGDASLSAS